MPNSTAENTSKTRDTRQRSTSQKYYLEPPPYTKTMITRFTVVHQRQVVADSSRKQGFTWFDFLVGGAYVEDHDSRFHATGSANHGCNEYCIRPDSDRPKRANDCDSPAHRDSTGFRRLSWQRGFSV